jgi:transcriptional regulator with XRE-family HTH domain
MAAGPSRKQEQRDAMVRLGSLLRQERERAGLRQSDVASALGRQQQFVSSYEQGGHRLDLWELEAVCAALGVELEDVASRYQRAK